MYIYVLLPWDQTSVIAKLERAQAMTLQICKTNVYDHVKLTMSYRAYNRVKSSKFGRSAKFGQQPCLFYILIVAIKNKLN